jgi:purine-nucleoside phosphorylase
MHDTLVKPVDSIVEFLSKSSAKPDFAVVLGSGVQVLDQLHNSRTFMYKEVFGIGPSVEGHTGSLTIGQIEADKESPVVAIFRGRFHLYEGHDWSVVTLPTQVVTTWGIPKLLLTNAAGGLNTGFSIGDLMVVTHYRDHLSPELKAKRGLLDQLSMAPESCENEFTKQIQAAGKKLEKEGLRPLQAGTYAALLGPSYETLAEIEMLRRLKADAVGMSTVPELLTAKGTGTTAAAVSVITNVWDDKPMGGHEEVLEASREASTRLNTLLKHLVNETSP